MASPRVDEIADEFGLLVALVMDKLRQLGEFVGSPSSAIQQSVARKLRASLLADGREKFALERVPSRPRGMSAA